MDAISQTIFSSAFSWMKMFEFRLQFHWSLFLRVQLTIFQHWLRWWLVADQVRSHYPKQWRLGYSRVYICHAASMNKRSRIRLIWLLGVSYKRQKSHINWQRDDFIWYRNEEDTWKYEIADNILACAGQLVCPKGRVSLLTYPTLIKWRSFCRQYFEMNFLERKCLYFDSNFTEVPESPIVDKSAMIQVMAWCQTVDKPMLLCKEVSHWLGTNLESALCWWVWVSRGLFEDMADITYREIIVQIIVWLR